MTGEGGEYSEKSREGHREHEEGENPRKEARDLIDELEREQEEEEGREKREQSEEEEEKEYQRQAQKMVDEAKEAHAREVEEAEADEERENHWNNEAEKCVKDAVKEIEREQEEDRKSREEGEEEYRQFQERGREERSESAEDDNLSEWEKDVLENYEKYGVDPEEVRELWREQFAKDVEDELEDASDKGDTGEKKEGEPDEETGQGKTEDTESYHDDGTGQMYATKSESGEHTKSKTESETTEETQEAEQKPTDDVEGSTAKESTEPKNVQSESEETSHSQEGETEEQVRNSSQEAVEEPKTPENSPKKAAETEYQERRTATTSTAEYSEEMEEKQGETKSEKKIESSSESETSYEVNQETREDIESSMKQEIEEEESAESDLIDELTPEDENWQKELNKLLNRLPEEFQEAIKDHLEEEIEDDQDFEEHAKKHGLEDLLEDEELMEEVRQFLRYRKARRVSPEASTEELAEEVGIDSEQAERWEDRKHYPDVVKKVLNLDGYRVLDNLARGFREQNYPNDMEELEEYLQNDHRLEFEDPMAPFEEWKREVKVWTEITKMRRKGKIKIKLRNGRERYDRVQIEGLSRKYRISKERIVSWLRGETVPILIEKAVSRGFRRYSSKSEVFDASKLIDSSEKFEQVLANNNDLRLSKRFENQYRDVLVHFNLQEGDVDLDKLARQHNLSRHKLLVLKRQKPWLLRELNNRELRRLYVEANGTLPEVRIESMEDLTRLLSVHQNLQQEDYEDCEKYFEVLRFQGKTLNELSKAVNASRARINWWTTVNAPKPIPKLQAAEEDRIIREWVKSEDFRYSISKLISDDETRIPQCTKIQGEFTEWKLTDLTGVVKQLSSNLRDSTDRLIIAEFQPENQKVSKARSAIEKLFKTNQKKLETLVKKQMDSDGARLALMDDKLFIWHPDRRLSKLINLYAEMNFYFSDKVEFARFIAEVKIGIEGERAGGLFDTQKHLEKLISQIFNLRKRVSLFEEKGTNVFRIRGEHLHLLLDLAGKSLSSLERKIERVTNVTGHGGIWHPRFPEGEKLIIILSRIFATIACDGHIKDNGMVEYHETELDRIDLVEQNLRELGDIKLKPWFDRQNNCYRSLFPSVIGNILQKMGIPVGDKTIQNPTLKPEFLDYFSWRALCAFVEDSVCEDGSVMLGRIWWTHACSLHPGNKIENYDFDPVVDEQDIKFIKKQGIESDSNWRLAVGKLRKMRESKNSETARMAQRLYDIVYANPNKLAELEKTIVEKLGIKVRYGPNSVYYHKKSQSVSVAWICHTKGHDEAMALAMIAPPNDVKKRAIMRDWIKNNPEDASRVFNKLERKGVEVQQWWFEE